MEECRTGGHDYEERSAGRVPRLHGERFPDVENVDVGSGNPDRRGSSRSGNTYRSMVMSEDMKYKATERLLPLKIFGPNLEEVLNAAGFYKREPLTDAQVNELIGEFIDFNSCAGDDREMRLVRAIERAHGINSDE